MTNIFQSLLLVIANAEGREERLPLAQHECLRRAVHPVDRPGMPRPVCDLRRAAYGLALCRVPGLLP